MTTLPEAVLARLTLRQVLARRRALALLALCALPVALALLFGAGSGSQPERETLRMLVQTFSGLILAVVLPLVALVVGTGVFGAEIDDGTVLFWLAKPVARWRMVLTRLAVATVVTAVPVVAATVLSGLLVAGGWDRWGLTRGFAVGVAAGAVAYCALFLMLSLALRRALVTGLAYVVVWEGTLSGLFGGTRLLSVRHHVLAIADRLSVTAPQAFDAQINPTPAVVMAVVVTAAATAYAIQRLRTFEVREAV